MEHINPLQKRQQLQCKVVSSGYFSQRIFIFDHGSRVDLMNSIGGVKGVRVRVAVT